MTEQFNAKAVLSASLEGFKEALAQLKEFKEAGDLSDIIAPLERAAAAFQQVKDSLGGVGKAAREGGEGAKYAAEGFDEYVKKLREANKAQQEFSQKKVMGQVGLDGIPASAAQNMTRQQRDDVLAVDRASSATVISEIKKINAAEDAAAKEREAQAKRLADLRERSMQQQFADIQKRDAAEAKAEADRIAAIKKREAAEAKEREGLLGKFGAPDSRNYGAAAGMDTASLRELAAEQDRLATQTSPRLRYALYDVGRTATVMAGAITAAGVTVGTLASQYESAFTNVERTLEDGMGTRQIEELRGQLIGLTREMPLAFSQITEIATLGNQLGIAGDEVGQFTETVAKFSAVTGLTVDATATAFGSLSELLNVSTSEFENLGSAIAYVGRTSVATEAEIVAMSTRLAASATNAGFSAQEVVALSGAFASLRIAPERAQGVMEIYFKRLNTAIANGGERLNAFASIAGVASGEVEGLVRSNPVEFFERLAMGLGQMDQITQTGALEALGLQGIRAGEVFGRVSANVEVFNKALRDSNKSWAEGSELSDQYALVLDDLGTQWQIFLNALMEVGAVIGSALSPALLDILGVLTDALQGFSEFASSDIGQFFIRTAGLVGALTAALASLVAMAAVGAGGMYALRLAAMEFGIVSAVNTGRLATFVKSLLFMNSTMATSGRLAVMMQGAFLKMGASASFAARAANGLATALRLVARATIVFGILQIGFDMLAGSAETATGGVADGLRGIDEAANGLDFGSYADEAGDYADELGKVGGAAGGAAKQLRLLTDYAGDLSKVMSRAFDIRFSGGQGMDAITSGWMDIADAADEAREAAEKHANTLAGLSADRAVKEYWLTIAEGYGDELRAAKIRAELAELDANMAKEQKGLAKAQDAASMSLVGNSRAAIENRGNLLGLVGDYQEYLRVLAASGMSQEDLQRESARLREDFIKQATSLGYSRAEVDKYAASFTDMSKIISAVPRNVSIEFDGDPALTALREFFAEAKAAAGGGGGGGGVGGAFGNGFDLGVKDALEKKKPSRHVGRAFKPQDGRTMGTGYGGAVVEGVARQIGVDMNNVVLIGDSWVSTQRYESTLAGTHVGGSMAGGVRAGIAKDLKNHKPLDGWSALRSGYIWNEGKSAGQRFSGGMIAGLREGLRGKSIKAGSGGGFQVDGGFASGGYTGNVPANQIAGAVHGREYVFSAPAVRNAGVNNLNMVHQMLSSGKGFPVAGGPSGPIDLSASSVRALAGVLSKSLTVVLPGAQLAGSVGSHNIASNRRGGA